MSHTDLTKDDLDRINSCDYYLKSKEIIKSCSHYSDVQVGEVYLIKYTSNNGKEVNYITNQSDKPCKYMVINVDDGFVFAKKINANGRLGVEVTCLTIAFPQPAFQIELDPSLVESILLDKEGSYDPMADAKELEKKKNRARRENKKLEIKFQTNELAKAYIDSLKIGDIIYDAGTSFGDGIIAWKVTNIQKRKTDKTPQTDWSNRVYGYGNTGEDQAHNKAGFDEFTSIRLEARDTPLPKNRRWINSFRDIIFTSFVSDSYYTFYRTIPATTDTVK